MMLTSVALLAENPSPTEEEIRWALSGNVCRCTGYQNIVKAVQHAAAALAEESWQWPQSNRAASDTR